MTTSTVNGEIRVGECQAIGERVVSVRRCHLWPTGNRRQGGPTRRVADRAERNPRGRSGTGEARPDDRVAVHFLPRRGEGDGDRSRHHADGRPGGAACGDAHLSNFGLFASPERELLFGLNDFDETLPGPFEYDLKRMAASFTIAARNNGFTPADARAVTVESVKAYGLGMAEFAAMRTMDIWNAHMTERDIQHAMRPSKQPREPARNRAKARPGKRRRRRNRVPRVPARTSPP
jgi:hypothetical protein